jgi:EAL domain-containing protein (putative c-di-GMP-specific phosphodiesterase class I)
LYFQPQATAEGEVFGFEALLRWRHPVRGMVAPGLFIPLAEATGAIGPIDEWVLREACRGAASWPTALSIAVNLSPVDFRRADVPAMILSILLETGLDPQRLEVEITEGVLFGDFERALSILRRIKNLGVIAMPLGAFSSESLPPHLMRGGQPVAERKRVKAKSWSPVLIQSEPIRL